MAKVVEGFSFPDDATGEEINAFLSKNRKVPEQKNALEGMPEQRPEMSWGEYGKGLGRSALAGATFNFSDEGIAGARSLIEGIPYEEALADERAKKKAFEEQYPNAAFGAEVVGGLPTMLIPGLGPVKAAQTAGRVGRAINAPVTQMMTAGAKQGALSGMGEAEGNIIDRAEGAVKGGATGAAVGAGLYGVGKVLAPVGKAIMERVRPGVSDEVAIAKVLQDLERSGMSPAQAKKEFEILSKSGAEPSYFDVNPSLTSRAESIVQREGAAGEGIVEDIAQRQRGQRDRIMGEARQSLKQTGNYFETAEAAADALRKNAKPLYDKAYEAKIPLEAQYELQTIMNDVKQAFPSAIKDAERLFIAERRGKDFKKVGTRELPSGNEAFSEIPAVRQWDYIMRGLGQTIENETDKVTGKMTQLGGAAKMMRNDIATILDNEVPAFGAARKQYKGDLEVKQALEDARKGFNRADPEELAIAWKGMSIAEKEAYRAGALKNIRDKLFGSGDFTDATKRIGQAVQDRRDALSIIMPDKLTARLFQDYLEIEAKLAANAQRIKGGSQTERRGRLRADLEGGVDMGVLGQAGQAAAQAVSGRGTAAMNTLFNIIAKSPAGIPEKRVEAIGQMLRANDMKGVERLTKSLEGFVAEQERKAARNLEVGTKASGQAGRIAAGAGEGDTKDLPVTTITGPGSPF
jgi:hypothetical protein